MPNSAMPIASVLRTSKHWLTARVQVIGNVPAPSITTIAPVGYNNRGEPFDWLSAMKAIPNRAVGQPPQNSSQRRAIAATSNRDK